MRKRILCLLTAALLLTGCTAPQENPSAAPVSPAVSAAPTDFAAPIGDVGLNYTATAALHLPSADGQKLLAVYEELTFTYSLHPAETILRALLSHPGGGRVQPVSPVALVPAGSDPVEVSGGVATVNLSAAAAELPREQLHTVCRAIAATLCELPDVTYVNILVSGVPVAMDEAGYLPLGAITAQPGQALPVLWELLLARRVPEGALPASVPLSAVATLYFPLADGSGVTPETRQIDFAGQHPQQLVQGLIEALSAGPESLSAASDLPPLPQLMLAAPEISVLSDGNLRATLRFTGDLSSWLSATGADPACAFAGLVCTLTTFVPRLKQVCLITGERAVTSVVCQRHGSRLFPGGLHSRGDYTGYLMAQADVYCPEERALVPHSAALPYRSIRNPRTLLLTLSHTSGGLLGEAITDADVLGLSVQGDTLLINLSARCAQKLREQPDAQRLAAYAIVNTMCVNLGVKRVRFFFASETADELGGNLVWSGEFLHAPGLVR